MSRPGIAAALVLGIVIVGGMGVEVARLVSAIGSLPVPVHPTETRAADWTMRSAREVDERAGALLAAARPAEPLPDLGPAFADGASKADFEALHALCADGPGALCTAIGDRFYAVEDYGEIVLKALHFYEYGCVRRDPAACMGLSNVYEERGAGVPEAIFSATRNSSWGPPAAAGYETACADGDAAACSALASMLQMGLGIAPDVPRSIALDTDACARGAPASCVAVGYAHDQGEHVPLDHEKGVEYARLACDRGHPTGCANLALSFYYGDGVPMDDRAARAYYLMGCKMGSELACKRSSEPEVWASHGVRPDHGGAVAAMAEACDYGDGEACHTLALLRLRRDADTDAARAERDAEVADLYARACDGHFPKGCERMGALHYDGAGRPVDRAAAHRYWRRGCDLIDFATCTPEEAEVCALLGVTYEFGWGTETDKTRAFSLYSDACFAESGRGCTALGYLYREGIGVDADPVMAAMHFSQGCDLRSGRGCYLLGKAHALGSGVAKDHGLARGYCDKAKRYGSPDTCDLALFTD